MLDIFEKNNRKNTIGIISNKTLILAVDNNA